jgi:hypothetical protein
VNWKLLVEKQAEDVMRVMFPPGLSEGVEGGVARICKTAIRLDASQDCCFRFWGESGQPFEILCVLVHVISLLFAEE